MTVSPPPVGRAGEAVLVLHDPRAVDGDTLAVDDPVAGVVLYLRLWGVAAPELDEERGPEARDVLQGLVAGRMLVCTPQARPSYGRVVVTCRIDGIDVARALVVMGVARDCPRYSGGRYARDEGEAAKRLPLPGYCEGEGG